MEDDDDDDDVHDDYDEEDDFQDVLTFPLMSSPTKPVTKKIKITSGRKM